METVRRIFELPNSSFFLFGPRGTGKSTLLRARLPDAMYVDLLDPRRYRELQARPETVIELAAGSPRATTRATTVILDEIQRIPELLNVVHQMLADSPGTRFILTGSSARKLKRQGTNLLGGRAQLHSLHPFMACELDHFDLEQSLHLGLLPLVLDSKDPQATLTAYATLYLEQEIQAEGLARNVGAFARFLEVMSFSHGAVLNAAAVARECEIERRTVVNYIEILEDLLLGFRLPVFTRHAQRKTSGHPKFYFFDAGVFRSLRPRGPLDSSSELRGAGLEGLVAQHLRAWIDYSSGNHELSFWRTRGGSEVDFVVYGEDTFCAIEVKNALKVSPQDVRGLRTFQSDYPQAEVALLYRGADRRRLGSVWCIPVQEFLPTLHPGRPIRFD